MAVTVDAKSVKITVSRDKATPAVSVPSDKLGILLHLTNNSKLLKGDAVKEDANNKNSTAFRISASADISFPQNTWFPSEDFGFIQLARDAADFRVYAGAESAHGMIEQNLTIPPLIPARLASTFLLDAGFVADDDTSVNAMPFIDASRYTMKPEPTQSAGTATVFNDMGDHPNARIPAIVPNTVTGKNNFLFRVDKSFEAITAFVHRDDKQNIEILATVRWWSTWSVKCMWRNGNGTPTLTAGLLRFDSVINRTTGSHDIDLLIIKPNMEFSDTCNMVSNIALRKLFTPGMSAIVNNEKSSWNAGVPKDFFQ